MWVYHIILIFCFFSAFLLERFSMALVPSMNLELRKQRVNDLHNRLFTILILYMIVLCGFRSYDATYHVGIDTYAYYKSYMQKGSYQILDILQEDFNDKGYVLLQAILAKLNCKFWVLLTLSAVVYVGGMAWYIKKYSKNYWMSIFIFLALGLYTFAFSGIRQTIAMGLCMIAYMLANKIPGWKGFLVYVGITYVAHTIHASAIIFLPVYFLQKIPYKTITVFIFLGIAGLTMLFKNQFANLILQLAIETSDKYEGYEMVENAGAGIMLYLFIFMTVALRLVASGSMNEVAKKDNSVYLLLCMLILFPATQSGGAMMRIYYYYYMFIIVFLPNVLESIDDLKTKQLAYLMLSLFLLWFYMSNNYARTMLIPYHFFWQV